MTIFLRDRIYFPSAAHSYKANGWNNAPTYVYSVKLAENRLKGFSST